MAEIEMMSEDKLKYLAGKEGFNLIYIEKDYFLTLLLYYLKDMDSICFKGGTALNKIYLNHARLSEDLDFAGKKKASSIEKNIKETLSRIKGFFPRYRLENQTEHFFRLKIFYKSFFAGRNSIILDINSKASIILEPERKEIPHFYSNIPSFDILTVNIEELVAEKIRTLITRNQPRDYFDTYMLIKGGYEIDFELVGKKLREVDQKLCIERIFKNAQKIYSRWHEISQLTNKTIEYMKVIKVLQKEFKYKSS